MGSYAAKEGLHGELPVVEAEGYRDEDDLAAFGKRPQLKVRYIIIIAGSPCGPFGAAEKIPTNNSGISGSFPWLA